MSSMHQGHHGQEYAQAIQEMLAAGANAGTSSTADMALFESEMIIQAGQELDRQDPVVAILVSQRVADRLSGIFNVKVEGLGEWMAGIQIIGSDYVPARFIGLKRASGAIEIIDITDYPRGTHERKEPGNV